MSNQNNQLTHWRNFANQDYLGSYSLYVNGTPKDMNVTLGKVYQKEVSGENGKKEMKRVIDIVGNKPMILNNTNAKTITKITGTPIVENWIGKTITLYVANIIVAGQPTEALRVRPTAPKLPELTPTHEKWNGALQAVQAGTTTIESIRKAYELSAQNEALLTTKPTNQDDTSTPNT